MKRLKSKNSIFGIKVGNENNDFIADLLLTEEEKVTIKKYE